MTLIKICGIRSMGDALVASASGADMLGFIFYERSPRYIEPALARNIVFELAGSVKTVGLFVNPDPERAKEIMAEAGLDIIQLQGDETPEFCSRFEWPVIKAIRPGSEADLEIIKAFPRVQAILIDAKTELYGGSGKLADWNLAALAKGMCERLILAGGLNLDNVAAAIEAVRPWAVDVCSGVEKAPGEKDFEIIEKFINQVKSIG